MDKKNIISTMIAQHRNLQQQLESVAEILSRDSQDSKKIVDFLEQFREDLAEHLKLENEVFYVELLKDMKAKGQDTTKTELFIGEMKDIEKVVIAFLDKFKAPEFIDSDMSGFKEQFEAAQETLILRVESEEVGVYGYWGLF